MFLLFLLFLLFLVFPSQIDAVLIANPNIITS